MLFGGPRGTRETSGQGCLKLDDRVRSLSRIHCKYVQLILVLHKIETTPRPPTPGSARTHVCTRVHARVNGLAQPPRVAHEFLLRPVAEDIKVYKGGQQGTFGRADAVGPCGPALTRRSLKEGSVSTIIG